MRNLLKKLNNFRLTALITSLIEVLGVVTGILFLLAYSFAGEWKAGNKTFTNAFKYIPGDKAPQILGMLFFTCCVFVIILGCFAIYHLFPAVLNKEKILPKKTMLVVSMVAAFFQLMLVVLTIVLLAMSDTQGIPNTLILFIVAMVLGIIQVVAAALLYFPVKECEFYMPEIKRD